MTLMLNLTSDLENLLSRRAAREGEDAQSLALRLLTHTLMQEQAIEPERASTTGGTMASLFSGRIETVSGSNEAYSENGGPRFTAYLAQKHGTKEDIR